MGGHREHQKASFMEEHIRESMSCDVSVRVSCDVSMRVSCDVSVHVCPSGLN